MSEAESSFPLVPRNLDEEYSEESLNDRRRWLEGQVGVTIPTLGKKSIPAEQMRGNIENPIGAAQVPLGVAGPLCVCGEHADGTFYVPLATTEGALVRSYERGAALITKCGGADVRIERDENEISPIFKLPSVAATAEFCRFVEQGAEGLRAKVESTTSHGKLLGVSTSTVGRDVFVTFRLSTGDAHGMNMLVRATEAACDWLVEQTAADGYLIFSGLSSEKRPSGRLLGGGKGKKVTAAVEIPERLSRLYLHASPAEVSGLWRQTVIGNMAANAIGFCGHYANGLTALFIACGQDVANVANAATGITSFEVTGSGSLFASVTLPSLVVATVGGGVDLPTSRECLELIGCHGSGKARKLAEITAALILGGELSFAGAIASGEVVSAHELYGRNRPQNGDGPD